jgi:hypothetical protein
MPQRAPNPVAGSGGAERAGGAEVLVAPAKVLPAGTGPDAGKELGAGTTLEIGKALETGGFEEEKPRLDWGGSEYVLRPARFAEYMA